MFPPPIIAIVDDDAGVRASLSSLMRALGYAVRGYAHGQALLDDSQQPPPACIISDVQMPVLDGEQLQAQLRARGAVPPMIFLTAFPTPVVEQRVRAAGAVAFLRKPVDADALAGCLQQLLEAGDHTKVCPGEPSV
ncbi:hypothetical protein C1924_01570 [Stenotrophomonas sp. ESTM1D_MKCIP4_1]|uniref:response regulator transcription factor n=1 Tax=Stenotrophomonas sp. ESTM1D_MKCIP4_1 TaxID=2072414 RepID=UPI000D53E2AA|nr:response regulator [Stenotrophomonas sp. ESTM1D_MKCIP4_1]AWH51972.1 hypothetical protein C1924_01570 [Stenotrophomonas sp. ESTM1D_MKCIP4_1]